MSLRLNSSGGGSVTLQEPVTANNQTLTLPDATGTLLASGTAISGTTASFSGNVTLGSSVLATPSGSAPSYLCRAWVNFDGTGTVAIRASGNVTSITDNGTGDYTVNFTTAMPDANYAALVNNDFGGSSTVRYSCVGTISTGSFGFTTRWGTNGALGNGGLEDQSNIRVAIFR